MEKVLELNSIINFGKHKGKVVSSLLNFDDIGYLQWLQRETDCKFSKELHKSYRTCLEKSFSQQVCEPTRYGHDASYGQAFDNCADGLMY